MYIQVYHGMYARIRTHIYIYIMQYRVGVFSRIGPPEFNISHDIMSVIILYNTNVYVSQLAIHLLLLEIMYNNIRLAW